METNTKFSLDILKEFPDWDLKNALDKSMFIRITIFVEYIPNRDFTIHATDSNFHFQDYTPNLSYPFKETEFTTVEEFIKLLEENKLSTKRVK